MGKVLLKDSDPGDQGHVPSHSLGTQRPPEGCKNCAPAQPPIGSRKGSVTTALWEDWPRPRGALPQSCHRAPGLGKQGDRPVRRTSPTGDSVSICIRYSLLTASATPRTQTQV